MAVLFVLMLVLFQSNQPSFENQIAEQTSQYLSELTEGRDLSKNYWALNEIYQSTCDLNNTVVRLILNSKATRAKNYYSKFGCSDNTEKATQIKLQRLREIALKEGLTGLAVNYLVNTLEETDRIQFKEEFIQIWNKSLQSNEIELLNLISKNQSFTPSLIPENEAELIYYSILFGYKIRTFFPSQDLSTLSQVWTSNFETSYKKGEISYSLQLANITFLLYELYQYSDLQKYVDKALEIKSFPLSRESTRYLNALSYSTNQIGRYDESLRIIREKLIPISVYLGLEDKIEDFNFLKGANLYSLGKFREAKEIFESIYNDTTSITDKTVLFNNLSICYLKLGEKNKYLTYQFNALKEAEQDTVYRSKLVIFKNLFLYYVSIGDANSALKYLKSAEKVARDNNDAKEIAGIHSNTATFYWETFQDAEKALSELKIAESELNSNEYYFNYVRDLIQQSEIYIKTDSLKKANAVLKRVHELGKNKSDTPIYLESLIGMTQVALINKDYDRSEELLNEIRVYPLDDLDFELLVKYYTVRSTHLYNTGSKRTAYEELRPVIDQVIDRARTSIDSQSGYWSMEQEYVDLFNAIISMLLEMDNPAKAVQLLDELKTINDAALYNSPVLRANLLSEEDIARDQILNTEIQKLRNRYLNTSVESEKFQIKVQIEQLSAQREEILNKIRTNLPNLDLSIWAAQKRLSYDEMIIHFTEVGDKLYSSYITNNAIKIDVIEFDSKARNLFRSAADNLASSETDLYQLYEVYQKLKLDDKIPGYIKTLSVIPDNYLYRIPVDILPTEKPDHSYSYGSTHYMIENYEIKYFTSLNELLGNTRNERSTASTGFSAFAISDFSDLTSGNLPSLPFATQEVRDIDKILNSVENKRIFIEDEATKEAFKSIAGNSRVIHIATHSEVSEQDPLFSTIYLNESNGVKNTNSALYAYELFETKLKNDLIMLNSCSSGSGSYLQGTGIMGISRALRYAGAKSLALNLWSVNDQVASEFAGGFYSAINKGETKSMAMRDAKLQLLNTGNANPYYWGSYMLIGNPSPLTKKPANAGLLYPVLLIIIVAFSFSIRNKSV